MRTLQEALTRAKENNTAIGHFNIANLDMLKAIFNAASSLSQEVNYKIPIIIGVSDGERDYIGIPEVANLIKTIRQAHNYPIFLNADHTAEVDRAKAAIDAGFDAVIIDKAKFSIEKNIAAAKEVADYAKEKKPTCLVEAELGYIGSGSKVLESLPEGAAITQDAITKVEEATDFVTKTGIDLFAPAVGNIHGMLARAQNPNLFIERIKEIAEATKKPLVLHGGSGIADADFSAAIKAGIRIIHISTELRRAWRSATEKALSDQPDQIAPYKVMGLALPIMEEVVKKRLKLFNNF